MATPHSSLRRRIASGSVALALTGVGLGLAGPAHADHRADHATPPGQATDGTPGSSGDAPGRTKDKPKQKDKTKGKDKPGNGNGNGTGNGNGNAGQGNGGGNGGGNGSAGSAGNGNGSGNAGGGSSPAAGGAGDPAGNNGTVKIGRLGDLDSIPNNTPHPGCVFQVEWYGFDEGPDVVSQVSFTAHAPTADVTISGTAPSSVFVGGDPATGAGTPTGLDGRQVYRLGFDGASHPKQGYHVKLTVTTPRSKGNDTKTKVFWVEPCKAAAAGADDDVEGVVADASGSTTPGSAVQDASGERSGEVGSAATTEDVQARTDGTVPTSVDAGSGSSVADTIGDAVRSPAGLALLAAGLVVALGALVVRRRALG